MTGYDDLPPARAEELRELNAGAMIWRGAQAVLGDSFSITDRTHIGFQQPGRATVYEELAVRLRYGRAMINFMDVTGWQEDNPALQYIAARLYLSFIDEALADKKRFTEEATSEALQEQRGRMQGHLEEWIPRVQLPEGQQIDIWHTFFTGDPTSRRHLMDAFRGCSTRGEGMGKAYSILERRVTRSKSTSARPQRPPARRTR